MTVNEFIKLINSKLSDGTVHFDSQVVTTRDGVVIPYESDLVKALKNDPSYEEEADNRVKNEKQMLDEAVDKLNRTDSDSANSGLSNMVERRREFYNEALDYSNKFKNEWQHALMI